jgi:autotransporter-associated beta strand protein
MGCSVGLPGRTFFDFDVMGRVSGRGSRFAAAPLIVLGVGAALVAVPRDALANCNVSRRGSFDFTCTVNTTTVAGTNFLAPGTTNLATQVAPSGGRGGGPAVDVNINPGVNISGNGLYFDTTTAAPQTITNDGSVARGMDFGAGLLFVNRGNGSLTYAGNGSVSSTSGIGLQLVANSIQIGTAATPVVPNFSGSIDGLDVHGHVAVYLSGGTINGGIQLVETGNNLAPISLTGHTTINNTGILGMGIWTLGSVAINSDANIGTANNRVTFGIDTYPAPGPVSITHGVGGSIFANTVGIQAVTAGASSDVDVTNNGAISVTGGFGIVAAIQSGSGNVTVHHNGSIAISPGTGNETGIAAGTLFNVPGNVTVSVSGNISTSPAANSTGINAVTANGNVLIDIAAGATISAGGTGIAAAASGGTTTINVLGTVSGAFAAKFLGTMNVGNGGTTGTIIGNVLDRGILNFNRADAISYGGVISDFSFSGIGGTGHVQQNGSGTLTLTGINTYAGFTNVNAGTLIVDGSIASSKRTNVAAGATLGGSGIVGNTAINTGGTLAPGSAASAFGPLTVQGNLTFAAASSYMIQVSPAKAGRTDVTGIAALGGATVNANFAPGAYVAKQYTIVNATGGVTDTFGSLTTSNMPSNLKASLGYDAHNAFLNVDLSFSIPGGLSGNQQNTANALTGFFNSTGGIPFAFAALSPAGLTQVSGETAVGSQQTTFDAMTQFMGVMTDPFNAGRGDAASTGATPYAQDDAADSYAAKDRSCSAGERDAYAAIYRKAPLSRVYDPRWSVWATGFGGSQTTDGNAAAGSNSTTSRIGGVAVGADYYFSPNTIAGVALAGGGTSFGVNGFGSGRSDLFQAGAFVRHTAGAAYVTAAAAYGWQDVTTDRTVTVAGVDRLRAQFNANAWSGRIEGGYRFVTSGIGLTPYAAGQFTTFEIPAYMEQVVSGANTFALAYAAKSVTASRSELGLRSDKSFAVQDAVLTVRGRAAWAHDFNTDRAASATFQTLPGASFVVNGAAMAHDAALTTAAAELKWLNGVSLAGTFEGEFSSVTSSYAGKVRAGYAW